MDKVIQDGQQAQYRADKAAAAVKGVVVLENHPCFEIWLLLHFVYTGKLFTGCDWVSSELRKPGRIPGYDKSEKFLQNAPLYYTYRAQLLEKAFSYAKRLEIKRNEKDEVFYRRRNIKTHQYFTGCII